MAEFYNKCLNNVVIYDNTLKTKQRLRWLHVDEISRLMGLAIRQYGPRTMFWDLEEDGPLSWYDWSIGLTGNKAPAVRHSGLSSRLMRASSQE
jgi:hypothetical protein